MTKEKVTLTLSRESLREPRARVGGRSLSAAVDAAFLAHLSRLRHLAAVDEWIAEMEREPSCRRDRGGSLRQLQMPVPAGE